MGAIIEYILNMLPYMLISVPIYVISRLIVIKTKKKKANLFHETALFLFVLFIVGLASQTVIPKFEFGVNGFGIIKGRTHETNLIPFKVLIKTYNEVFINGYLNYFLINFLGNIIMFMPFGFFVPLLWKMSNIKVIAIGFCSSLFIELCQLLLARATDIDDLMLNTVGTILGLLVYKLFNKLFEGFAAKFK